MTAAAVQPLTPHLTVAPKKAPIIPLKIGWYGAAGDGKTTSAGLAALALSKEIHGGAPVWATDSEDGWKFLKPIYAIEKVELVIRKVPTFLAMRQDLRDAQRAGACVWNSDSLTTIFREWLKACQKKCGMNGPWGNEMRNGWTDFVQQFLTSPIHCQVLGRIKDVEEEMVVDENGNTKKVKIGDKLNAGGAESFTFEPHLALRLSRERKDRVKRGLRLEAQGRVIHRVDVEKDRTWALSSKIIRWTDMSEYKPGGYREVWNSLFPHYRAMQATEDNTTIDLTQTSEMLIPDGAGGSDYYERRQRRDVCAEEIKETLDQIAGGQGKEEKYVRREITRHIFGILSKEAVGTMSLDKLERGLKILQAFERRLKREKAANNDVLAKGETEVLAQLDIDIREHDEGSAEENELPF